MKVGSIAIRRPHVKLLGFFKWLGKMNYVVQFTTAVTDRKSFKIKIETCKQPL